MVLTGGGRLAQGWVTVPTVERDAQGGLPLHLLHLGEAASHPGRYCPAMRNALPHLGTHAQKVQVLVWASALFISVANALAIVPRYRD